ncbi:zinc finger and BTB domain-containing protein 11-like [Lingula anatina]|uniref:Zinc finger and BTB domain-containing protein 11-like n=1 Tax=Lingula anatina TaxID=7574 RepID=A0A1S3HV53_LINAN|nr:zinc finger and BTB domain-containing protein 11-like [Lingula anatina]XP_013389922.2 zinc finger and BTB domain-containing protein 11-like [Lingula anatina]|eukprot:XP_013389809.2 zinc finger and BTB domain-containing protein 11-like [Lingula anatina]
MLPIQTKSSHFESILAELNKQRLSKVHCDVSLVSDLGVTFPAHRCVLAASCGYFRDLLNQQRAGSILVLNDYSTEALQLFIEVIYTGRFQLPKNIDNEEDVKKLRHLATLLDLQTAVQLCDEYLRGVQFFKPKSRRKTNKQKSQRKLKKPSSNQLTNESAEPEKEEKEIKTDTIATNVPTDDNDDDDGDELQTDDEGEESPVDVGMIEDDSVEYIPTGSAAKQCFDDETNTKGIRKSLRIVKRKVKKYPEEEQIAKPRRKIKKRKVQDDSDSDLDDSIVVESGADLAPSQPVDPVTEALNVAFGITSDLGKETNPTPDPVEVEQTFDKILKMLAVHRPQQKIEKRGRKPKIKVEEKESKVAMDGELFRENDQSVLEKFAEITTKVAEQEGQTLLINGTISTESSDFDTKVSKSFKSIQEQIKKRKLTENSEVSVNLGLKKKPASAQEEEEWRNCLYCKQFRGKRKGRFEFHARYCNSQYRCQLCYKPFLNEFDMKRHHCAKEKKSVICEQCGKTLTNCYALALHMQVHSGVKKHACQHCGKLFLRACQLKAHVVHVHTTERPHKCVHCGKAFGLKYELNRHLQNHSTAYNFICNQCGAGFHENFKLNQHVKMAHKPMNAGIPQVLHQTSSASSQITFLAPSMTSQAENSTFTYPTNSLPVNNLPNSVPGESLIYAMVPASSLALTDDLQENDVTFQVIQAIQGSYSNDQPNQDQETRLTTL